MVYAYATVRWETLDYKKVSFYLSVCGNTSQMNHVLQIQDFTIEKAWVTQVIKSN